MSKKVKFQGKKLKNQSDPKLARSHRKGDVVRFAQSAADPRWGRYLFFQYRRFYTLLNRSGDYYEKSIELLEKCRQIKVDEKSGIRTIPDKLKEDLEINSMQFVILSKLGYEYLYVEHITAIRQIKEYKKEEFTVPSSTDDLAKKLTALMRAVDYEEEIPQELFKIFDRRDMAEHPTSERLWGESEGSWKNVHLSWVLSGEIEGIMDKIIPFTQGFIDALERYDKDNPIPGGLKIEHRGLKAGEQYKNPTKSLKKHNGKE